MQYLSKAYNYYSGINPATLSGAIDVIVIRHVDKDGEVTLSSSPFHVRFGKLQVLRAGEKRVTLRLPNNLPSPHVAPFSMKVGETGEAFFVLETEEDVPEELLTSPVVMATEPSDMQPSTPPTDQEFLPHKADQLGPGAEHELVAHPASTSLTQQPFGETEEQVLRTRDHLGDVDFLDLNDTSASAAGDSSAVAADSQAVSPSSILNSASSLLPSFLSTHEPNDSPDATGTAEPIHDEIPAKDRGHPVLSQTSHPPNPLAAAPGESTEMPDRDVKLSDLPSRSGDSSPREHVESAEDGLPKVREGEGEGPEVVYGRDVVLDMAGYHAAVSASEEDLLAEHAGLASEPENHGEADSRSSVVEAFTRDLVACTLAAPRPSVIPRPSEPILPKASTPLQTDNLSLDVDSLSLDDDEMSTPRRFVRGQSEPPQTPERPISPTAARHALRPSPRLSTTPNGKSFPAAVGMHPSASNVAMDYAWDWGKTPPKGGHLPPTEERVRSESMPPTALDAGLGDAANTGRLKNVEENPYLFVLEMDNGRSHAFELALCGEEISSATDTPNDALFVNNRVTFQRFIEDPQLVDDPRLVVRYSLQYYSWKNAFPLLSALSSYRRSLTQPPVAGGVDGTALPRPSSGYGWTKWLRRGTTPLEPPLRRSSVSSAVELARPASSPPPMPEKPSSKHFAKTLRLASDQLKQLHLKPGPNTVQFSVTSSYSGMATCASRIFLWEETDQIVISDIDGTITKSDALGHVFAAIGRDWTHPGIAKLYTDIGNNGYKMLYLTSRAIGQADSTREYLRTINQGDYRMPEGPVIMSPDRLMASLHREVIMRKPELFKMACLRDIQRLFGDHAREAFFAGFGNRITDAMSYRSVGIDASKIYTIDSTGVVKTELLQAAGHKGSYMLLNDLVNEVFPPVRTKFKPEYTDFNYWRPSIANIPLPDLSPPSPALSARSDSSRLSVGMLGKIATLGRRSSKQPILPTSHDSNPSSRPSSPLIGPAMTPDDLSEADGDDLGRRSRESSMPGSFEDRSNHFPDAFFARSENEHDDPELGHRDVEDETREGDSFDDGMTFDDDLLATGEMQHVPF